VAARPPARPLVLASASPARLALLRAAGIEPEVIVSDVPEDGVGHLPADEAVRTLADRKASAVAERLGGAEPAAGPVDPADPADLADPADSGRPLVLGCDSMLAFGGEIRGKPTSDDQARAWWRSMAGGEGTLLTGHAVVDLASGRRAAGVSETRVRFGRPTEDELDAYVRSGEPLRVAGAFTLDGRGAPFVEGIDGDPGTVIGLSLPLLRRLLADLGVAVTDLWAPVRV
jgi:septum formation protein